LKLGPAQTSYAEAKGHGVPEVMDAVYHRKGVIRPMVFVVKSAGFGPFDRERRLHRREGPIIQIGSSFASTFGQ
jgi:CIC family chloride channel protein